MQVAVFVLSCLSVLDVKLLLFKELFLSSGSHNTLQCMGHKFVFQVVPGFGILKHAQGQEC